MGNATQGAGGPLIGVLPDGATVGGTWTFTGRLLVTDTTASTGATTGCAVFSGGIGVAANVNADGQTHRFGGSGNAGTSLIINGATAQQQAIVYRVANVNRWVWGLDAQVEGGSNAGSGMILSAVTDAGAAIDNPIWILRASAGLMTLGGTTKRTIATTGGRVVALVVATDTLTLDATHHSVVCNKSTAMTVNLPAVAANAGREYIISNKGAGVVTIDANASELIDNATTKTLNQWQSYMLHCDGAIWKIVG